MLDKIVVDVLNKGSGSFTDLENIPDSFTELENISQESFCDHDRLNIRIKQRNPHWWELLRELLIKICSETEYNIEDYDAYIKDFLEDSVRSTVSRNLEVRSALFYDMDSKKYTSSIDGSLEDTRDITQYVNIELDENIIFDRNKQINIPIKLTSDKNPLSHKPLYIYIKNKNKELLPEKTAVLVTNDNGEVNFLRTDLPTEEDIDAETDEFYNYYIRVVFLGDDEYYSSQKEQLIRIKR